MKNNSPRLEIIGHLAREYDEKYHELGKLISEIRPESMPSQLKALEERCVKNFRSAQAAMLSVP